ncbi:hypothetical protein [Pseudorhodobacter sp.]|uniref:hypothetical protein n=1 Tax=Pseudorhodobacter sp. TaxID=1934400 RepID=UPI002B000232|nr:hypothetical protein [Pseudorhodobacter sp.]
MLAAGSSHARKWSEIITRLGALHIAKTFVNTRFVNFRQPIKCINHMQILFQLLLRPAQTGLRLHLNSSTDRRCPPPVITACSDKSASAAKGFACFKPRMIKRRRLSRKAQKPARLPVSVWRKSKAGWLCPASSRFGCLSRKKSAKQRRDEVFLSLYTWRI